MSRVSMEVLKRLDYAAIRRQLDYLRTLGASKESAKELKLFDLSGFLTGDYLNLSNQLYDQNLKLSQRRLRITAASRGILGSVSGERSSRS